MHRKDSTFKMNSRFKTLLFDSPPIEFICILKLLGISKVVYFVIGIFSEFFFQQIMGNAWICITVQKHGVDSVLNSE